MELRFYGATGTTTGSCHLVRSEGRSVLLDCGLFQGRREESRRRNEHFGFDVSTLGAVIQSHAHIDHSGKLPMLERAGFAGAVHATAATRDLCEILLVDSAHIQLQDAQFLNKQRWREAREKHERRRHEHEHGTRAHRGHGHDHGHARVRDHEHGHDRSRPGREPHLPHRAEPELPVIDPRAPMAPALALPERELVPLYLEEDVRALMPRFQTHAYGEWFEALPGMRFRFRDAGHILGSAWIEARIVEGGREKRLVFTGDYGRFHQPILRDPEPLEEADLTISESTYGNRTHPAFGDMEGELAAAVARVSGTPHGRLLIPAFAVGRTQNILYALARLCRDGRCPNVRFVVDSPLASAATRVVLAHPECFDAEALAEYQRLQTDERFLAQLAFTHSIDESKALNDDPRPLVILSASGMLETGRILHHLAWNISNPAAEVLIVGFQAEHTLGRQLLEGAREVRILGLLHTVRARITPMLGFSAHADRDDLLRALTPHAGRSQALFLVHGENDQRRPLAEELRRAGYARVELPEGPEAYRFP